MNKLIPLTQGFHAVVDEEDYDYLIQWDWYTANCNGVKYAAKFEDGKLVLMHRFIMNEIDANKFIDHKDGDSLNNCKDNLRGCSHAENMRNRVLICKSNTSGFKGVCWNKNKLKWHAQIRFETRKIHLGYFLSIIDAAKAYNEAAIKYHGEFARLNRIPE